MSKSNIANVIKRFLHALQIPITDQGVIHELRMHPNPNSLLAISDVLNNWHVPNLACKVPFEQLVDIPVPYITLFPDQGFVLITKVNESHITVNNGSGKEIVMESDVFKNLYSGSVLVAEKNQNSGELNFDKKHAQEMFKKVRIPFVLASFILVVSFFLIFHNDQLGLKNYHTGIFLAIKTLGLVTSIFLLVQSIDSKNPLIKKICGISSKLDCNSILDSKAAKVYGDLSWSEVGFFYFGGTWLMLIFNLNNINFAQYFVVLNLISLPYTFYSIYYQWNVARRWCIFCCAIQAFLWLEFCTYDLFELNSFHAPYAKEFSSVMLAMSMPVLGWVFVKPYLIEFRKFKPMQIQLQTFKYNIGVFNKFLKEEVAINLLGDSDSLILGNENASNKITIVSNPYCSYCSKVHTKLMKWLDTRNDIKLQIVFLTNEDTNNPALEVASHFLSLWTNETKVVLEEALNNWYDKETKDYKTWAQKYPISKNISTYKKLEAHLEWCKTADITSTPTILINGRKLPRLYQFEEIKYLI